jgi:ribosomal 50S subunit-associated protein YjgA (DUF615 family)
MNPVNRLVSEWFEIEGVKKDRRDFGFIGKLYKTYGEATVQEALQSIKRRPSQATNISRPREYLRGICRKIGVGEEAVNKQGRDQLNNMMKDLFN